MIVKVGVFWIIVGVLLSITSIIVGAVTKQHLYGFYGSMGGSVLTFIGFFITRHLTED